MRTNPVPLRRPLVAWTAMAVAMSANGALRELALKPRLGDAMAEGVSALSGVTLIQLISRQTFRGMPPSSLRQRSAIASLWLLLTLGFEFTFGHWVDEKSWSELFANYNVFRGRLWPVVLATLVAAPFLWSKERP